jgi:hypothetical protein
MSKSHAKNKHLVRQKKESCITNSTITERKWPLQILVLLILNKIQSSYNDSHYIISDELTKNSWSIFNLGRKTNEYENLTTRSKISFSKNIIF